MLDTTMITHITMRRADLSWERARCSKTSLRPPMALPWKEGVFEPGFPLLKRISRNGLSMPTEIRPNTRDRILKNMYRANLPLYRDKYWRITANFCNRCRFGGQS